MAALIFGGFVAFLLEVLLFLGAQVIGLNYVRSIGFSVGLTTLLVLGLYKFIPRPYNQASWLVALSVGLLAPGTALLWIVTSDSEAQQQKDAGLFGTWTAIPMVALPSLGYFLVAQDSLEDACAIGIAVWLAQILIFGIVARIKRVWAV